MDVGDDLVAVKALDPADGFADDRRTQMSDVQRLGDIRAAEVHHDFFRRFGFVAAEPPVAGHGVQFGGNEGFFEADVDKARPVDRYFGNVGVLFQFAGNQSGNLTRVPAQWLGQRQRAVALKIAQVRTVGNLDDGKFGVQAVFCKNAGQFLVE